MFKNELLCEAPNHTADRKSILISHHQRLMQILLLYTESRFFKKTFQTLVKQETDNKLNSSEVKDLPDTKMTIKCPEYFELYEKNNIYIN